MRRLLPIASVPLCALAISACATTTSTSNFKGEEHAIAQRVANLQSDETAGEEKKICADDLAASAVKRLGGQKGCEAAVKDQVVDNTEAVVESVQLSGATATAKVKSTFGGKKRIATVAFQKEGSQWKISALQ
jgi:uncharacterized glyoxalase superfamily protein PhnB